MLANLGASTVLVIDEGRLAGVLTRVTMFKVEKALYDALDPALSSAARASVASQSSAALSPANSSEDSPASVSPMRGLQGARARRFAK